MDTMSWVIAAITIALFAFILLRSSGDVSGADAERLVGEGATLLDVRTPGEFNAGAIEGAINIPVQVLPQRLASLGDKDAPVVVYCRSGARSAQAKALLTEAGFSQVHDLGAKSNWAQR